MAEIDQYLDSQISDIKSSSGPSNSKAPADSETSVKRSENDEEDRKSRGKERGHREHGSERRGSRNRDRHSNRDRSRRNDEKDGDGEKSHRREKHHRKRDDSRERRRRHRGEESSRRSQEKLRERSTEKKVTVPTDEDAVWVAEVNDETKEGLDKVRYSEGSRKRDKERSSSRDRERRKRRHRDEGRESRRHRSSSRNSDSRERRRKVERRNKRSKSKTDSREKTPPILTPEEREAAMRQAAIDELTRDQRTVFVYQITTKVLEEDLKRFFEKASKAPVKNVIMLRDKITNKHRGFAYVEMKDLDSVPTVLQFNNTVPDFQRFPIMVKASEAEKNYLAKEEKAAAASAGAALAAAASNSLAAQLANQPPLVQITNIHPMITEDDLRTMVQQCGGLKDLHLRSEHGMAEIAFYDKSGVDACVQKLDGYAIAGKKLVVTTVPDPTAAAAAAALASASYLSGGQTATANWRLDDDTGMAGVAMNSNSRVALMAKLAQGKGIGIPLPSLGPSINSDASSLASQTQNISLNQQGMHGASVPPVTGNPSFCILIRNMYNAAEETEDGWELDIKEDAEAECLKYGKIKHSYVDSSQPGGLVYVMFRETKCAKLACAGLQGRWFAKRMLTVEFISPSQYIARFPETKHAAASCIM
mmetsp:Transcript_6177/g.9251  ORF Transcript_6177/g.9251 Transcript_6177/m.9251 type:complete len:647 (+) Transcript_6177:98-2038(+)